MSDMIENFTKETELTEKKQIEILEMESSISEIRIQWKALKEEYTKWKKELLI